MESINGRPEGYVSLLDKMTEEQLDIFVILLLSASKRSLLPEIMEVFDGEHLAKFLDIFAGTTFKVPPRDTIENAVRGAHIYAGMASKKETLETLGRKYEMEPSHVHVIHEATKKLVRAHLKMMESEDG